MRRVAWSWGEAARRRGRWLAFTAAALMVTSLIGSAPAAGVSHARPRLLFGSGGLTELQQRMREGVPAQAWAKLQEKVNSYTDPLHANYVDPRPPLGNPQQTYHNGFFGQNQVGTYLTDIGLAYALSGEERYGRHAAEMLLELAARRWPAWNQNELGQGDLFKGAALAFDWIYDILTDDERQLIVASVVAELPPLDPDTGIPSTGHFDNTLRLRCLDRDSRLEGVAHNWVGVCGGGTGLILLAIEGEPGVPDLSPWLDVAHDRVSQYFQRGFGSGGGGAEGVNYASYGLHNALPFAFAWQRRFGDDLVAAAPGLRELSAWLAFEQLPGGGARHVPRNDSQTVTPLLHEVVPMLFDVRPDGLTGWLFDNVVGDDGDAVFTSEPVFLADPYTANHTCTDLLESPTRLFFCWRSPEVFTIIHYRGPDELPRTDPVEVVGLSRHYADFGLVNARTGWARGADEVLATYEAKHHHPGGHSQADLGSFTLYGYGANFAIDAAYGHNYSCNDTVAPLQGCTPGPDGDARIHSGRAIAHNVVIVDGFITESNRLITDATQRRSPGNSQNTAIKTYVDTPGQTLARSDLRAAYEAQVSRVPWADRDVLFSRAPGEPVLLVITDWLRRDDAIHAYEWQMHTDAGNVVVTSAYDTFTVLAPSGATLSGAVADTHRPGRQVYTLPWDNAVYNPFESPLAHTIIRSKDDQARRRELNHLAVLAVTPSGSPAAGVERLACPGCNLVRITWVGGEALVASSAYGPPGVEEARLTTDGDLARATVLPEQPAVAIARQCAAPTATNANGNGPGCIAAETVLAAGTHLTVDGREYVTVSGPPATVVVSGDAIKAVGSASATYRVFAPQEVTAVMINGQEVPSQRDGLYVAFGGGVS